MTQKRRSPLRTVAPIAAISTEDLAIRQSFMARRDAINEALAQANHAAAELDGAWAFWREGINRQYGMTPEDYIRDDGVIVRVGK